MSLYRSLIQSRLDYRAIVYNSCRPSRLKQLNSVQLPALRLTTGAFRTSPAAAVLCDTSILPLDLRRDLQTISYASQIISRPTHMNHANFMADNDFSNRPTVSRPGRIRYLEACIKYSINENTIMGEHVPPTSPWQLSIPQINPSLTSWKKDETPASSYRVSFKSELESYQNSLIIYTDGSKTRDGVGAAMVTEEKEYSWSLNPYCTIFTAELYAIWQALLFFCFSHSRSCVICSDSLSAIRSIENKFTKSLYSLRILELVTHLSSKGEKCTLLWIPSHSNILGNEKADIAAQQATLSPEDEGIPIPSLDLRIAIKEIINKAWQERWSTQDTQLNNQILKSGLTQNL
ncbi:hypothetical protein JTB14_001438 [Gonioctena quinquepunctata]|nr:hypothetical protein JTB14_001438 [Gonioctena quinquepunctata]